MNKIMRYATYTSVTFVLMFATLIALSLSSVEVQNIEHISNYTDGSDATLTREEWNEWYRNASADELKNYHNVAVRDAWVAQYDFEQDFHPEEGYVVEYLSALIIQKEMLQGMHDNEDDERVLRYHNWLLEKFDVPHTIKGIDNELLGLVGRNVSEMYRIDEVHYHNMHTVKIAEPPFELWWSDPDWWWLQNRLSACQYNDEFGCDDLVQAIKDNRQLT